MGSHQRYTHQCILWSTCRWNNGVDEDTFVKSQLRYYKCLLCITHIERNDRRFCLTDFEACIAELLQGIVSDVPQTLDAFRFGLDDVKRLAGCSRSSRCATCLEYIGTGIVAQPIDYRLVSSNKPPMEANDLLNVPIIRSTSSVTPKWSHTPRPCFPNTPKP